MTMEKSSYAIKFLCISLVTVFIIPVSALSNTIKPGQSIRDEDNATVLSASGRFQMGFFSPANSRTRYFGVWYAATPDVFVWIANRETPLMNSLGALHITHQGSLVLIDGRNSTLWSANVRSANTNLQNPVLQLQDSGNLVVKRENGSDSDGFLWESFGYPCDNFLSGMKIGRNFVSKVDRLLTSWRSEDDPAPGQFSLWIDPRGYPQLVVRNGSLNHYRLGSWNGVRFTGTPQLSTGAGADFFKYEFWLNETGVYYSYESNSPIMSRLWLNRSGYVQRLVLTNLSRSWTSLYAAPLDICDHFSVCGANMLCNVVDSTYSCNCLEGFVIKYTGNWSAGCIRRTQPDCKNDIFQTFPGLKLPDTSLSWYNRSMSLEECQEICSRNCSCNAYANTHIVGSGSGCLLWFADLIDLRQYSENGQSLYIRMSSSRSGQNAEKVGIIVGSGVLLLIIVAVIIFYIWKKKQRRKGMFSNEDADEVELPTFSLSTLEKATDNFSSNNKLGQGGFGPVYKGTLANGQEIAVKRLSKSSGQGLTEFKNEVILIAKLQHRNLVRLLGCCIEGDEKMLIYEFMPNKSLDFFIFDQTRSSFLDWDKCFQIIGGIARGLLYLHHDSRLRIIHRDLKVSNILLDKDMIPKISDFGMARMFGGDETEANTNKIVGTYGYMSPEYAVDGLFSMKSDIFSFGVLVLEIISGRKNRGFSHPDHQHNLIGHAWLLWTENKAAELVDKTLENSVCRSEILRCIQVALLCVQQRPEDRPSMSSVVLMLGSEISLPQPQQPGFFTERNLPAETDAFSSKCESSSINEVSITLLEAR